MGGLGTTARLITQPSFQLFPLSPFQAGRKEQPSTARVEGAAFPISTRVGGGDLAFLLAWASLRERIRPQNEIESLRAGERLEDGRLFDEVLGCAHAGYHGKSPRRNDQA
jgi:hypothetical protein